MERFTIDQLREKANMLPLRPGVYLMLDSAGEVIYIGKAKALKNRVSQYFGSQEGHAEKVRRIRAWAEEQPEAVDFARSRAYGDTAGDLPMLRLVGEGFAVNPKRKLRRAAKKENIPILRWR